MTTVIQGKLGHCQLAQDIMYQMAWENKADVLVLSEQLANLKHRNWYSDTSGRAAIWVRDPKKVPVEDCGKGNGYEWVISGNSAIISCYLSPNEGIAIFPGKLVAIENRIPDLDIEVILAGDFNAKSSEWGMTWKDPRGKELAEMVASLDLTVLNVGNSFTFRRPGYRETIPGVTLAS
ncbi:uncharacterized protein LOC117176619 [Belonocnema kinseyi]|uniref:uncharacterized protein LOC117176619 n=1 Tax=Belonocnema kinseyi TaxID=2817044 RepID=UPI00143DE63F|nr:uncharacterized protein LOC117176619 [Belonocnema kinseyi]